MGALAKDGVVVRPSETLILPLSLKLGPGAASVGFEDVLEPGKKPKEHHTSSGALF